jgi:MFS family permease
MPHALKHVISTLISGERSFFPSKLSPQLREFYLSNAILQFAQTALLLFEPIYLYTIGFPLWRIMFFYFAVYAINFFLMPLGGKLAKIRGFEHSMLYSSFFQVLCYIFLLLIPYHPLFVWIAIIAYAIQKTMYWPSYHADFAFSGQSGERGRQISNLALLASLAAIAGPLVGGVLVKIFGFVTFFCVMSVLIILSNIPMLRTREIFSPSVFSYKDSYRQLFARENRRYLYGYIGFGEELIAMTVWPIFLFVLMKDYAETGGMIAASTGITGIALLIAGRKTDLRDRLRILQQGALFTSCSWLLRGAVPGVGIFFHDIFSRVSKGVLAIPLMSGLYDHATHSSIVRTIVFFEMSLTIGKVSAAGLLALFFYFFNDAGWNMAFLLAAAYSFFYFFLTKRTSAIEKHLRIKKKKPAQTAVVTEG